MTELGLQSLTLGPSPQDPGSTIAGANITISGGAAGTSSLAGAGGNLVLAPGASGIASLHGLVLLSALVPQTDPHVKGALYAPTVAGAVSVSGG